MWITQKRLIKSEFLTIVNNFVDNLTQNDVLGIVYPHFVYKLFITDIGTRVLTTRVDV